MKISVVAFGKLKTPGLRESADYYKKLALTWGGIDEIELKPLSVPDKSQATRKSIQTREGSLLLEKVDKPFYLLDEGGKAMTTQGWAALIEKEQNGLTFCVGSSLGFSAEIRAQAKGRISLGSQTLPHELARVVLFEQIYRAMSVFKKHPYHNEGQ